MCWRTLSTNSTATYSGVILLESSLYLDFTSSHCSTFSRPVAADGPLSQFSDLLAVVFGFFIWRLSIKYAMATQADITRPQLLKISLGSHSYTFHPHRALFYLTQRTDLHHCFGKGWWSAKLSHLPVISVSACITWQARRAKRKYKDWATSLKAGLARIWGFHLIARLENRLQNYHRLTSNRLPQL